MIDAIHDLALSSAPFVAIDFETADDGPDSACAVALVRVEGTTIVARQSSRLRPPREHVRFKAVHGMGWEELAGQPTFASAWPLLRPLLDGAHFLAAHHADFDRGVLHACCHAAGLEMPALPFVCSMELARRTWDIQAARLPNVCAFLHLPLKHHDPSSDAEACAKIIIAARERWTIAPFR